jgi:hypothetical protein
MVISDKRGHPDAEDTELRPVEMENATSPFWHTHAPVGMGNGTGQTRRGPDGVRAADRAAHHNAAADFKGVNGFCETPNPTPSRRHQTPIPLLHFEPTDEVTPALPIARLLFTSCPLK